ncbi:MAG TPA: cytochrome d ubiquinol oxidase subunit II, partial [Bacteroidales bacterium]|nr:cytochrome d ubiquinol oxidase subunit II [Bacteroidales bacterium]
RSKPNNFLGARTYEVFLFINGALGTILLGTAVATFFTGSEFYVNDMNSSFWEGSARGLELALNPHNLSLGFAVFFLARTLGVLYFMNNVDDEHIFSRAKKQLIYNAIPFVVFFLIFVIWLLLIDGFAYHPETKEVFMEPNKYLHNFLQMPVVAIIFMGGVLLVLFGIGKSTQKTCSNGIWFAGPGTLLTVLALFLVSGFNHTAFYPSTFDLQSSLTIENASSSKYTLTAMSYVSLMVPFVAAYIWHAWKSINNKKIDKEEMGEDTHVY